MPANISRARAAAAAAGISLAAAIGIWNAYVALNPGAQEAVELEPDIYELVEVYSEDAGDYVEVEARGRPSHINAGQSAPSGTPGHVRSRAGTVHEWSTERLRTHGLVAYGLRREVRPKASRDPEDGGCPRRAIPVDGGCRNAKCWTGKEVDGGCAVLVADDWCDHGRWRSDGGPCDPADEDGGVPWRPWVYSNDDPEQVWLKEFKWHNPDAGLPPWVIE